VKPIAELSDEELAAVAGVRERLWQEALCEIERRRIDRNHPAWDENLVAVTLARKRADTSFHPRPGERYPSDLPPTLFRMGYEWAFLTVVALLERILAKPSDEIMVVSEWEHVEKGLYRKKKNSTKPYDFRRRAAVDLIEMIEQYGESTARTMLFVLPRRRATYTPADDDKAGAA
jgi:hypothetical protein